MGLDHEGKMSDQLQNSDKHGRHMAIDLELVKNDRFAY